MPIISRFNDVSASDYWIGYQGRKREEREREREWYNPVDRCPPPKRVEWMSLQQDEDPWGTGNRLGKDERPIEIAG